MNDYVTCLLLKLVTANFRSESERDELTHSDLKLYRFSAVQRYVS